MSNLIYYGSWINWSRGKCDGATITLTPRSAGILIAFLAIFVSIAGGSLWRIIAFTLHQRRSAKVPRDGLYYQQQVILRNAATPGVASWQLLWLVPAWRKLSRRSFWKSVPLVLLALVNLLSFFAAGILVAEVTQTAGSEVLVRSSNCGNWTIDDTRLVYGFTTKTLNDTVSAATYARACYGGPSDALECKQYKVKNLPYTITETEPCPFDAKMCLKNYPVISLDTGYELAASEYSFGSQNLWLPDKAVRRDDGDLALIFLMANDIRYYGKVEDPIFLATGDLFSIIDAGQNVTLYTSNFFVNPLACIDQHQFCNPSNNKCTKLDAYTPAVISAQKDLEYNPMQYGTVSTLSLELYLSTISQSIGGRGSSALRAQEVVSGILSGPLPKDQWKKEVEYWFTTGLSKVQKYFVDYATGPSNVFNGTHISKPYDGPSRQLCNSQIIKAPAGSNATSFSTLGVAIILTIGGLIILVHMILEYTVTNIVPAKNYRLVRWALDDKLQLQRLAFEGAGVGQWNAGLGAVPTTKRTQTFGMEIGGEKGHPTMTFTDEDEERHLETVVLDDVGSLRSHSNSVSKGSGYTRPSTNTLRNDSVQIPPIRLFEDDREGDNGHAVK
ncbi:hypothetical protein N0V90_010572 [Kalmusia sp. IMI 367209]|nr:hypothetical protein N0V90_010572 [Kalmusia sp. IMI 367209]